ncbi:MAG: VWA domain-containing protein [Lacipirellulaceae bacterium]
MSRKSSEVSPSARTVRIDREEIVGRGEDRASTPPDPEALETFFVEVSAGIEATTEAASETVGTGAAQVSKPTSKSSESPASKAAGDHRSVDVGMEPDNVALDAVFGVSKPATGGRRRRTRKQKQSRYLSLSFLAHLIAFVVLSTYTMQLPPRPESLELSTVPVAYEDELIEEDLEIDPITEEELAEGLESELLEDPLASEVSLATELEFESDDSEQTDSSQNLDGLLSGELLGGGLGMEGVGTDGIDSDAERVELPADPTVTFFGEEIEGKRIVFLVDNSGGMNGGGLETLIAELLRTVDLLTPKQQFYVIFYSDVAYPLFYPRSVYQFVRPTKENKRQLAAWLDSVELCTGNAVDEGLKAAITTRPDTVFLLTDGRVNTTRDGRKLAAFLDSRGRRFAIHTFGMGTSPTSQATLQLKEIAAANGGRFKQIEITEEMKSLARERRRPYHNKQPGAVWGKKVGSW